MYIEKSSISYRILKRRLTLNRRVNLSKFLTYDFLASLSLMRLLVGSSAILKRAVVRLCAACSLCHGKGDADGYRDKRAATKHHAVRR